MNGIKICFLDTNIDEAVYNKVKVENTFESESWSLDAMWSSIELKTGDDSAYVLAMGFLVSGTEIDD